MGIDRDKITSLEIDLIDACNLSCPLCNRNRHISKDGYLVLEDWENIINNYPRTEHIYFIGTRSEHTLYPFFLELCSWIKAKKIKITISTNGCTNKATWWARLQKILTKGDEVRFAIDGITQDIYEKYRVGGDLKRVLENHKMFKGGNNNDTMQYIEFEHNKNEKIDKFSKKFSKLRVINTSPSESGIVPRNEYVRKYKSLDAIISANKNEKIDCETKNKLVFINHNGDVSPCCHYNENRTLIGNKWDNSYSKIESGMYDFCTPICNKKCKTVRKALNIEL